MIIYRLNSWDTELTDNLLGLGTVSAVNDLKCISGCGGAEGWEGCVGGESQRMPSLGMEPTTVPGSRFLLPEKGWESEQISSPCLRQRSSLSWLQGQEFCEGKHCPSHSSLSAVSSSWHDKIPKQRDWGCVIQKCPVVWVEKRGKHQMLLFKQRPSFMLNTTKITWFSVLRIKKKREKKKPHQKTFVPLKWEQAMWNEF